MTKPEASQGDGAKAGNGGGEVLDLEKDLAEAAEESKELAELGFEDLSWEEDEYLQKISAKVPTKPTIKGTFHGMLRKTRDRYIAAQLLKIGRADSSEVRHESLKLSKYGRASGTPGYDFENALQDIEIGDQEIERLRAFLEKHSELKAPAEYILIPVEKGADEVIRGLTQIMSEGQLSPEHLISVLKSVADKKDLLAALASQEFGDLQRPLAAAIQAGQRQRALELLVEGIENGEAEAYFQKLFTDNMWMFGNRYVGVFERRRFTTEEVVDIPLLRADGYAEIVELKRPDTDIFVKDGEKWIVSAEVNKAVNQAGRYISEVERQRDTLQVKYGVDFYKVAAKVVIGLLDPSDADYAEKREALRLYNSHLHRVEILTYSEVMSRSRALIELDLKVAGVSSESG